MSVRRRGRDGARAAPFVGVGRGVARLADAKVRQAVAIALDMVMLVFVFVFVVVLMVAVAAGAQRVAGVCIGLAHRRGPPGHRPLLQTL
ncbi:MAG: hypothetical protein AB7P21_25400 [Lautropia sp.]